MNASMTMKLSKRLSFGEEVANSVTHAVGTVAMLVLLPITAIYSYQHYGMEAAVGMSIFDVFIIDHLPLYAVRFTAKIRSSNY